MILICENCLKDSIFKDPLIKVIPSTYQEATKELLSVMDLHPDKLPTIHDHFAVPLAAIGGHFDLTSLVYLSGT